MSATLIPFSSSLHSYFWDFCPLDLSYISFRDLILPINMQALACSPAALHSTLTMDERWQKVPNAVEVESILFANSNLKPEIVLTLFQPHCKFFASRPPLTPPSFCRMASRVWHFLVPLALTYMPELKTPASKPFIFIYSKFLYIGSNEYKADFTAIQNVGAKSIFLACHFVPVILLYILWWLALLFCLSHCLLFQSPPKLTTLFSLASGRLQ